MYYPNNIEDICYEEAHIEQVIEEIRKNFLQYFELFLETESGNKVSGDELEELAKAFGCTKTAKSVKQINKAKIFKSIIKEAIDDFEKDRPSYLEILDLEALEEHEDDPPNFKNSVLRNSCPIIRLTLQNKKAKELDKYRAEFRRADANELLTVVWNLTDFAIEYTENYDEQTYEEIQKLEELGFSDLDEDDYIVYGVIGGGIKSHLLYKMNPSVFPNRGRESIWALWYLTNKKHFNCTQDSEFLSINLQKSITQQNFFYPYELFSFYAFNIYKILKEEAEKYDVYLDPEYRYVFVNAYLSFVAQVHAEDIEELKSSLSEDSHGYY